MQAVIVVTVDVAQVLFTVVLILLIIIPVLQAMTGRVALVGTKVNVEHWQAS